MSDHAVKKEQNKSSFKVLKWFLIILAIAGLEAGGIATAVKLTELRQDNAKAQFKNNLASLSQQLEKLNSLEQLSSLVGINAQHLEATSHTVNLLSESFSQLEKEVGGNQIEKMNNQITRFDKRLSNLEEVQSLEPVVLAVALMIKENALYGRPYAAEADVLTELGADNLAIGNDIKVINSYKDYTFADNQALASQYKTIMEDFNFPTTAPAPEKQEDTMLSKGVKILKDAVANVHFDRIAVLKKQKKTDEEKNILLKLDNLVSQYNYKGAIDFIRSHEEFANANNAELNAWAESIKKKIDFEDALNNIIASQLKSLRQAVNNHSLTLPKAPETTIEKEDIPNEEVL